MNEIKIYLKPSGSIAELYKDFNLYSGSYLNTQITVYVPKSLLFSNEEGTFTNTVKTGALLTAPNGSKVTTKGYPANYIRDETVAGADYAVYTQLIPKEYLVYAGTQSVIVNVVALDTTDVNNITVIQVTSSQVALLTVLESAYLSDEDIILPSDLDVIYAQLAALQNDFNGLRDGSITAGVAEYYAQADGSKSPRTIEQAIAANKFGLFPELQLPYAPSIEIAANNKSIISTLTGDVTITLGAGVEDMDNEWAFVITQPGAYIVNLPAVNWVLGAAPLFDRNSTTYVILYYVGDTLCGEWRSV